MRRIRLSRLIVIGVRRIRRFRRLESGKIEGLHIVFPMSRRSRTRLEHQHLLSLAPQFVSHEGTRVTGPNNYHVILRHLRFPMFKTAPRLRETDSVIGERRRGACPATEAELAEAHWMRLGDAPDPAAFVCAAGNYEVLLVISGDPACRRGDIGYFGVAVPGTV